jgi:hypothetical protein
LEVSIVTKFLEYGVLGLTTLVSLTLFFKERGLTKKLFTNLLLFQKEDLESRFDLAKSMSDIASTVKQSNDKIFSDNLKICESIRKLDGKVDVVLTLSREEKVRDEERARKQ